MAFFADEDAVGAAMECNKKDLGKRYVVLQPNGSSRGGGGGGDRNGGRQGDSRYRLRQFKLFPLHFFHKFKVSLSQTNRKYRGILFK